MSATPLGSRGVKFVLDSLLTYGTEVVRAVLLFGAGVIVARALGPEGRGIYAVLTLVPMTLFQVGNLGLFQGLVHGVVRDPPGRGHRAVNAVLFGLLLGLALAGVAWAVFQTDWLSEFEVAPHLGVLLALSGPPALLLGTYARALVLGLDDLAKRNWVRLTEPVVFLLGAVGFLVAVAGGVAGAMAAWAASQWAAALLALVFVTPLMASARLRPDLGRFRIDLRFGLEAYGAAVAGFLLFKQGQFLVAWFLPSEAVGHFAVAQTLIMTMGILPAAVQASFLPKVTARFYEGSGETMTPFVCRMMVLVSAALAVACAIGAYPGVWLLYGEEYLPAAGAFLVMLPTVTLLAGMSVLNAALQARSAHRWISIAAGSGLVVNLAASLLLIPTAGILGAALASSVGFLVPVVIVIHRFLVMEPEVALRDLLVPSTRDVRRLAGMLGEVRRGRRAGGPDREQRPPAE